MEQHRLTIWEGCSHDVEIMNWDGHITCADCGHVRMAEVEVTTYEDDGTVRPALVVDPNRLGIVNVHSPVLCASQSACPMHNPSQHHMRGWRVVWRNDRGILERVCPHGCGHPDPDQFPFWDLTGQDWQAVHGCDGCCTPPYDEGGIVGGFLTARNDTGAAIAITAKPAGEDTF